MKLHRLWRAGLRPFRANIAAVESPEFQRGIALFDQRQFFEAHGVLEDIWRPMELLTRVALPCRGSFKLPSHCTISPRAIGRELCPLCGAPRATWLPRKTMPLASASIDYAPALNDWIHALEHHGNPQAPKIEFLRERE